MLLAGATPEEALEALARGLTNKLLHAPVSALNQAGDAERAELMALFQRIYKLPEPPASGRCDCDRRPRAGGPVARGTGRR